MALNKFTVGQTLLIAAVALTGMAAPVIAQADDLQKQVESIQSVEQVKDEIRQLMKFRDQCNVGSCWNSTSTSICSAVGALDIRVDGKIFSSATGWTDEVLPISQTDLNLMKQIFSQCKPSNYQYWNFGQILHVLYNPTPEADQQIRRTLGLD